MKSNKIIKVCGMREGKNILSVDALGVDLMGFIFYPQSPRFVESMPESMPCRASRVGVFVNATLVEIESAIDTYNLEYVQLHGSESPEFCSQIQSKVIKAFAVDENFDFKLLDPYAPYCHLFLFDTKCSGHGGSGKQFDWSILDNYTASTPFLLSGGLSIESIEDLKLFSHHQLAGYDLNSCFELSPALKDVDKLNRFLEQLKKVKPDE